VTVWEGGGVNRLASATSPYLLQHADNPVAWWEWSAEAFAEAKRRDVPVLISVGYAACHWCHVMAHESFEDDEVAALVNDKVVSIKVDREERPDVDAVYMTATQAMTGQGGWPMTVFATPDGEPFFCGTYFPKPAFVRLVQAVADAWQNQREQVLQQGAAVVEAVVNSQGAALEPGAITKELLDSAAESLKQEYDPTYGGFGGAPKFPPHLAMLFLMRHHQRTGDAQALEIVRHTAEAMARGGIYDQLAGGFARYSVDTTWTVPHFEKMLYDNALLLRVYTMLWRLTGDAQARRIAHETARFLVRDLQRADGGFASSVDADTNGVEGATYVWTPGQIRDVLDDADDAAFATDIFDVTGRGTFEHGTSVLRLARDIDDAEPAVKERWTGVRETMLAARNDRPQPTLDDKVVAAWNGLAVTALAEYESTMDGVEPGIAAATRATAAFLADRHIVAGRLRRASRHGVVGEPAGVLDDYGCVAEAFTTMHQLTGEARWLELAGGLLDAALAHFADASGGFHDTADDAETLVARPADPTDNATPSGLSSIAAALLTYSALSGETRYHEAARLALESVATLLAKHARFAGYAAATAEALLSGPYEIAVVTVDGDDALARTARRLAPPGAVVVVGPSDAPGVPLLADRPLLGGRPTAYVCRGFVCDRPVTAVDDLTARLSSR
jgi:uncharacterized protein YyaL (SSP411 family)